MNRFENRPKGVFQNCTNVRFPKLENVQWYAFRKYTDISFHTLISFSCFSLWRRIKASINDFSYSECFCFLWFYHRTNLPSPKNWWISGHGLSTVKRALDISSFVKLASSSATSWRYMQSVSLHCWPFKNLNLYVISRTEGTLNRGYDRFYSFRYFVRPWTLKEIVDGV